MSIACFAGIDEAGYGPLLGPMVVALAGFPVSNARNQQDLWTRLSGAVSRIPTRDGRLAVCDSKRLFARGRSKSPLAPLETSALAFLAWRDGSLPRSTRDLLDRLGARIEPPPLYDADLDRIELPLAAEIAGIEHAARRLEESAGLGGLGAPILEARVVTEREYNRECERLGSKARLLFQANVDVLLRARSTASAPLVVCCDRHGGRARYRDLLGAAFPFEHVVSVAEARDASSYRIGSGAQAIELEYRIGGEEASLPTALASIVAKYLREIFMTAFNRCLTSRVPTLVPTAGYWTDGQRFLAELTAAGHLSDRERDELVRRR